MSLYNHPENYGFNTLGEVDFGEAYEFDMYVVFTRAGIAYWAQDSGCSCPVPFEYVTEDDLTKIADSMEFQKELRERAGNNKDHDADIAELVTKVHHFIVANSTVRDGKSNPVMK